MKSLRRYINNITSRLARAGFAATLLAAAALHAQPVPVFTNVWQLPPLTFAGITTNGNDMRGVAIAPATTNVLFSSRVGGTNQGVNAFPNHANVVDFATGTNLLTQLRTVPSGSQFNLDKIGVADDGKVYGCNLTTAPTGVNQYFKIYQWPSESDASTEALYVFDSTNYFNPISGGLTNSFGWRIGDYMDVRGSGTNTEIVVAGNGTTATNIVIFRPTDAALTNFSFIVIPTPLAGVSFAGSGIAFEGTNNAVWCRQNGSANTRRIAYNPITLTSTMTHTNNVDQSACQGLKYISANGVNMLATVQASATINVAQRARVFTIPGTPTGALVSVLNSTNIPLLPGSLNGNALGQVDAKLNHLAFGAPGSGVSMFRIDFITNSPPTLVTVASSANPIVEGFNSTLSVTVSGSSPLTYLWFFNNTPTNSSAGANTNVFPRTPAQVTDAGNYFVIVTNLYGSATSGVATLTVLPGKFTPFASNLWSLAPGSRPYLTTGDTQRGIAHDPVRNKLIVVSRSSTNGIHVLDAVTGADENELDIGTILANPPAPGTFTFNMCGVADDGAVYVGNLITSGGADNFTIYRWADSTTNSLVSQSYLGNPAVTRLGDTMAVRGSGVNTEILCSFRTGTNIALFTTADGSTFTEATILVTNLPADAQANGFAGLGLAFGPGQTFWAKSSAFNLRLVAFDTNTLTATVVNTYTNLPASEGPLGADNVHGYVATIGINQNPHNLSLWDVARGEPDAFQLDRELFATSNVNGNGTGAVAVDPVNRRIYALDSNNGLIAMSYSLYYVNIAPTPEGGIVTWPGTGNLQSAPVVTGTYTDIIGATTPYTNTSATQIYFRVRR